MVQAGRRKKGRMERRERRGVCFVAMCMVEHLTMSPLDGLAREWVVGMIFTPSI